MSNVSRLESTKVIQTLSRYNTKAELDENGDWMISGELVDLNCYARLAADSNNKFCLVTAGVLWDHAELSELQESINIIVRCLTEINEINPELVRDVR